MTRTTQTTITYDTTSEEPIFNDYRKLFSSYGLYFNDQVAEEINEDRAIGVFFLKSKSI